MNLKKIGNLLTSKSVGTGPSSYGKRIYWAAVWQRLRNTALKDQTNQKRATEPEHVIHNAHGDIVRLVWEIMWLSKLNRVPVYSDYRRPSHPHFCTYIRSSFCSALIQETFNHILPVVQKVVLRSSFNTQSYIFFEVRHPRCVEYKLKYNMKYIYIYNTETTLYFMKFYSIIIPATCFGPICRAMFRLIFKQGECQLIQHSIYEISYY